ncbi:MAG: hypothetical protein ACOC1K_06215 [Nanoarchaeota archaeon]
MTKTADEILEEILSFCKGYERERKELSKDYLASKEKIKEKYEAEKTKKEDSV